MAIGMAMGVLSSFGEHPEIVGAPGVREIGGYIFL
jgi:hypothetical protein